MGDRIVVTKPADLRRWFSCKECGHRRAARIHVDGVGIGNVPVYDDTIDLAKREAEEVAERNIQNDAVDALKLVPCPKCGKRNRGEVVDLVIWTVVPAAALAGMAYWMFHLVTILGLVLAAASFGLLVAGRRRYSRAGHDVTFLTDD